MAQIPLDKLESILDRSSELERSLSNELSSEDYVKLSKEYSEIEPLKNAIIDWKKFQIESEELTDIINDETSDSEMLDLAKNELEELKKSIHNIEESIQLMLLPKDKADANDVILEIRAGTGGDEAAIFAGDLYRMYQRYSDLNKWKTQIMALSDGDVGGYKEIILSISGENVFSKLKFESGVHRVQRVPATESSGRIHTSAATVAVLPEPEDVDVEVQDKDIRIDVFRASGPGGQSVNTTDSAVRITHLPSGIVVSQQDEKSQHKNKAKAMKILRARLYEAERDKQLQERAEDRKGQVGSGDRSERIRTYNYPQGRVTDHRINLTLHKLETILEGQDLVGLIEALITEEKARQLSQQN
ncbi:MAG: peptide chain release factor 1 [Pseudomonadota bacterium]|jgi:peptide chain release factor 1|nr:peptide chain release factor 1 [Pseudomonadota bacterium]|tara:strand:- start:109 stop:1185 length:1077 start_codon:yes stop_codon:yes gene_type:complete